MKLFKGLTKEENAWVLYDVGNSAFTMLSCSLIPIYFKAIAKSFFFCYSIIYPCGQPQFQS